MEGYGAACLSKPRLIDGKGGWFSNGGKLLEQAVKVDARKLLEITRIDLMGGYKKKQFKAEKIKGVWIFDKKQRVLTCLRLIRKPRWSRIS